MKCQYQMMIHVTNEIERSDKKKYKKNRIKQNFILDFDYKNCECYKKHWFWNFTPFWIQLHLICKHWEFTDERLSDKTSKKTTKLGWAKKKVLFKQASSTPKDKKYGNKKNYINNQNQKIHCFFKKIFFEVIKTIHCVLMIQKAILCINRTHLLCCIILWYEYQQKKSSNFLTWKLLRKIKNLFKYFLWLHYYCNFKKYHAWKVLVFVLPLLYVFLLTSQFKNEKVDII